ncbi:DUF1996 domain-containing protein [Sphingopyxis sp.]|uniref:DUF1996 domain-containing protein n=1 Tax=Sphingopyxis sp. TaxID=1908224 RepID=UPI0025E51E91|nr:DUF1996 domain-containing protein [Sphingopyxis sp.]MBK6414103.1 DUF1996 domain-containing protein [Sphingopyxis sp.]
MRRLALLPVLLASSATAQTTDERLQKARDEVNLVENAAKRAVAACDKKLYIKCRLEANDAANAARRALYAIDAAMKHQHPVEPPVITFPKVGDVLPVASGLNIASLLGAKSIPPSGAPDVVGAFRFLCGPGQISNDDPIVYPGKKGAAHTHQFFGNLGADANSTYDSLRKSGESTCQNDLNRSAYWMPAMLDGKGNVVRPDFVSIYYKRRPASDAFCSTAAKSCAGIPRGLRFVFGWDQTRPNEAQPDNAKFFNFKCVEGWSPTTAAFPDMVEATKSCKPGQWLSATISTPECWNGVGLDSKDHRSHLAAMVRDRNSGKLSCPATHPVIIPQFTMGVRYSIEAGEDPTKWELSSDHMLPAALRRPGASFHSDYFEAWQDEIRLRWEAGCLDKMLNCSDGDLGDGQIMARGKHYPQPKASPRLVPVS